MTVFNEYGNLDPDSKNLLAKEAKDVDIMIGNIAKDFFEKLLASGVAVVEVRAFSDYMKGAITLAASEKILFYQIKKAKEVRTKI